MKPTNVIDLGMHTVELTAMLPTDDGRGKIRRRVGERTGHVVLRIDALRLAHYCHRALHNKNGRAHLAGGALEFLQIDRCPNEKVGVH